MSAGEKDSFFMSESLKGKVDTSQFYDDVKEGEGVTTFYFSEDRSPVNVHVDNLEIDNENNVITLSFECNASMAGKMVDGKFKRVDIDFGGYPLSRKIKNLISTKITFPAPDLCFVVLSFDFIHHI